MSLRIICLLILLSGFLSGEQVSNYIKPLKPIGLIHLMIENEIVLRQTLYKMNLIFAISNSLL